jgi:hypothetical protein
MGQRGMYLAVRDPSKVISPSILITSKMLSHAGMLEAFESHIDVSECQRDPEKAWEDWKEHEGKHRYVISFTLLFLD